MRILFLILMFALPVWAIDTAEPADSVADSLVATRDVWHYPDDGATEIDTGVTVKFVFDTAETLVDSQIYATFAGLEIISDSIYDSVAVYNDTLKYTVTLDGDTLEIYRLTDLDWYHEITVTAYFNGDSLWYDTITFRTEGNIEPFSVTPSNQFWDSTTAAGRTTLTVGRPFGTTIYGIDTSGTDFTVYEPSAIYATERTKRRIRYSLEDIPEGYSYYQFFAISAQDTSDTLGLPFYYRQSTSGRAKGGLSR